MKGTALCLLAFTLPAWGQVRISRGSDRISVEIDGKPFTDLFLGPGTNKPFLYPLRSASGKIVTRRYPIENLEGEKRDHPHQKGLWFSHGKVNGFDYWSNEPFQKDSPKGKILLKRVGRLDSGSNKGSLTATFEWVDAKGKPLMVEDRKITFYSKSSVRIMDFDLELRALERVKFEDTKEGLFAIRIAAALEEPGPESLSQPKRTGRMVDSEGRQGEAQIWGKRANWVDYAGELDGEKLGIAIMDHPGNPKHPTFWHARSYGLFAANPFGEHDFFNDKSRDGSVTVEPGHSLRFRYRVVIHPGDHESAGIAQMYQQWSSL